MLHIKNSSTRSLYRWYNRPTFLSGVASLFDIYNVRRSEPIYQDDRIDVKMMEEDFRMVGRDIRKAISAEISNSHINEIMYGRRKC